MLASIFNYKWKLSFLAICVLCLTPLSLLEASRRGARPIKKVGDAIQIALPVMGGSMTLLFRDFTGTLQFAKSFGTTFGVTWILKPIINADRPMSREKQRRGDSCGKMSFPSGHTAAAFGGAAFLQMRYGWGFGVPCYLAAGYVGFSRIYGQRHWFRDTLGGAAIAVAANVLFTTRLCKKKVYVAPIIDEDQRGISLFWEL
ncbi:MAG: hypothetical protein S4CHLAM7_11340 [Chlamydiae bacterium]|nr:hypothetical protein [Chlamydiota bacterium]